MKLCFPNPSRSHDAANACVRFWGYDSSIEVSFLVDNTAIEKLCPGMDHAEGGVLDAFDNVRSRIHEVAEKVYERRKKGLYAFRLCAEDL